MSSSSSASSHHVGDVGNMDKSNGVENVTLSSAIKTLQPGFVECKLCLQAYPEEFFVRLEVCGCIACVQCMTDYVETMLNEGRVLRIPCPVNQCSGSYLTTSEVRRLLNETDYIRYQELKYLKEVEADPSKTFCPRPGCEHVCDIGSKSSLDYERKISERLPLPVEAWQMRRVATPLVCSKCRYEFCTVCKTRWHETLTCEEANSLLKPEERSILFCVSRAAEKQPRTAEIQKDAVSLENVVDSTLPKYIDVISEYEDDEDEISTKPCPVCALPIERDEGCAKIQCARCNHTFCWYCLQLLDEDFLWMHYESGPCKDRIDVPPAQVHTYRLTAILTMAGLGLLILVASPVIIVAAPCLLCYKFCPKDKNTDDSQQNEKTSLRSSENSSKTNGNAFSATGDSPCADSQCRKKSSVFACCPCGIL